MRMLRVLRDQKRVSQAEVAKAIGVDRSTYGKYETGDTEPNLETIQKMADYYGCTLNYILTGNEEPLVNNDPELTAYLEELRTRPEQRMLMGVTKDATKEQIEAIVDFITRLRGEEK